MFSFIWESQIIFIITMAMHSRRRANSAFFSIIMNFVFIVWTTSEPLQLFYATLNENGAGSGSSLSGSVRGGTMIYINGLGFPTSPQQVEVFLGNYPCTIPGEGLTTNFLICETSDSGASYDIKNLPIQVIVDGA